MVRDHLTKIPADGVGFRQLNGHDADADAVAHERLFGRRIDAGIETWSTGRRIQLAAPPEQGAAPPATAVRTTSFTVPPWACATILPLEIGPDEREPDARTRWPVEREARGATETNEVGDREPATQKRLRDLTGTTDTIRTGRRRRRRRHRLVEQ